MSNIINLDEFLRLDDELVPVTKPNSHGVFYPDFDVMVYNDGRCYLHLNVAHTSDGWRWCPSWWNGNRGGGSYPHHRDTPHKNKREILTDISAIVQKQGLPAEKIAKMIGEALVIQKTLFD